MKQSEREEFISIMSQEGVPLHVSRAFLRAAASLHRLAELECSSEAADRDRVSCPTKYARQDPGTCLCRDYGSYESPGHDADCARRVHGANECTCKQNRAAHGTIPRYMVSQDRIEKRVHKLAKANGLGVITGGDPRGAVLIVTVPSGRTNDWGGRGIVAG